MKSSRNLVVSQKAHLLTLTAYDITRSSPKEEMFGLTSQIRRCASSIAANIAEGCGKRGNTEFQRFLGLCKRAGVSLLLACDLRLLNESSYEKLNPGIVEIKRMLASLVRKIEQERLAG